MTTPADMNGVQARPGDAIRRKFPSMLASTIGTIKKVESDKIIVRIHGEHFEYTPEELSLSCEILLPHPPSMPLDSTGRPIVLGQIVTSSEPHLGGEWEVLRITDGLLDLESQCGDCRIDIGDPSTLTIIEEPTK